jgi:hypothetical protein
MTTNMNYGKNMFKFNLNHITWKKKNKNIKYVKQKCKWKFILVTYETMNMKRSEQGYDARSYFKLVLNKLKVMGGFTFVYIPLGT